MRAGAHPRRELSSPPAQTPRESGGTSLWEGLRFTGGVRSHPNQIRPSKLFVYNYRDKSIQAKLILPRTTVPQADATVDFPL